MSECLCPKVNVTMHVATLATALGCVKACLKVANEVADNVKDLSAADAKKARKVMRQAIAELEHIKSQTGMAIDAIDASTAPAPSAWTFTHG
jgi:hypothetical protein